MTWIGEGSQSGVLTLSEDGSPRQLAGSPGNSLVWSDNGPEFTKPTGMALDPIGWTPTHSEGFFYYDTNEHAFTYFNDEVDVAHQVGQEFWVRVYNETGSTITDGQIVYISGVESFSGEGRPAIALAQANAQDTSLVVGWATHDIETGTYGYITHVGLINGIDTSSTVAGDVLYLSDSTPGAFSSTPPAEGGFEVVVGYSVVAAVAGKALGAIRAGVNSAIGDTSQVIVNAQKGSAGTISLGDVVRITGYDAGAGVIEVELADATSSATMPAFGIARSTIDQTTTGDVVVLGQISNVDTSSFSVGDILYVSETAGDFTNVKPTSTALIQNLGIVSRANVNGRIQVFGAGRSNDLPNIGEEGGIWVGDANGVPTVLSSGAEGEIIKVVAGSVTWGTDVGSNHNLLSETHSDTEGNSVFRGALIYGSGSGPTWAVLPKGANRTVLKADAVDISWAALGIDELSDVDTVSSPPAIDDVLRWNGISQWIPSATGVSVEDEGLNVGVNFATINFVGEGVAAADGGARIATITINGSGNVGAYTPSTDNAIVRYAGTTGRAIQDSIPIITDSGNIEENKLITFAQEVNNGNSGTAYNLNWREGQKQRLTLTGDATLTFTNPVEPCNLLLKVIQDGTGTRTPTWPTGVLFPGGTDPSLTTDPNAVDIVSFYWDGVEYFGVASLDFS